MDVIRTKFAAKAVLAVDVAARPRSVTILGSTGSVGRNTVDLIGRNRQAFVVEALTANRNVALLAEQARHLKPRMAVVADAREYKALKEALAGTDIAVAAGSDAVIEAAAQPADWVMAAIVGAAGLLPTLTAVRRGATVGLANKECLVSAGDVFVKEVKTHGATLLPVDSEHSAIFQVFDFDNADRVQRIILTASGGPFREFTRQQMRTVTPEQAVAHPNWSMGAKISVDSATMMNKGLEVIEAHWLFNAPVDRIDVVIHPQSVIHSLVDYIDGSVLAQLGNPDMRTPIANALAWPARIDSGVAPLDLFAIARLDFQAPDEQRFPCLRLARQAAEAGNSAPAMLNAANEVAVAAFLDGRVRYLEIASIIEEVLNLEAVVSLDDLDAVFTADARARELAGQWLKRHGR